MDNQVSPPIKKRIQKKVTKAKTLSRIDEKEQENQTVSSDDAVLQLDPYAFSQSLKRTLSNASAESIDCMDIFLQKLKSLKIPFNILMAVLEALKPFVTSNTL